MEALLGMTIEMVLEILNQIIINHNLVGPDEELGIHRMEEESVRRGVNATVIMTQIPALSFKGHLVADVSLGHTDHGMDLMFIVPHLVLNGEMIIQIGQEIRELFGILAVRKKLTQKMALRKFILFRSCALKWHPDKHQGPSQAVAAEKFKQCSEAYQFLCKELASA